MARWVACGGSPTPSYHPDNHQRHHDYHHHQQHQQHQQQHQQLHAYSGYNPGYDSPPPVADQPWPAPAYRESPLHPWSDDDAGSMDPAWPVLPRPVLTRPDLAPRQSVPVPVPVHAPGPLWTPAPGEQHVFFIRAEQQPQQQPAAPVVVSPPPPLTYHHQHQQQQKLQYHLHYHHHHHHLHHTHHQPPPPSPPPQMERTSSGISISSAALPDIDDDDDALLSDAEAARIVALHAADFSRRHPDSPHARILRSLIANPRQPVDDAALASVFSAANALFFGGRLSRRVHWDWSAADHAARYGSAIVGTTAMRRRSGGGGGYEALIVLSTPLLRQHGDAGDGGDDDESGGYDRRLLLISTFLHELIHSYLFVSCGRRAAERGGHTRGFREIAALMDDWAGKGVLHLREMEADLQRFRRGRGPGQRRPCCGGGGSGLGGGYDGGGWREDGSW